jgi:hypothetical protein
MGMEQTRLSFKAERTGTNYIDLTKALTLVNGKHYTQFKSDKPQAFTVVARTMNTANSVECAPTSWAVRNGLVKTAAAWRKMLRKAGVSKKDLNTYGKEIRMALDTYHSGTWGGKKLSGATVTGADLVPDHLYSSVAGCEYDTGMKDGSGNPIYSSAFQHDISRYGTVHGGVYREHAFDQTVLTVPNASGNAATELGWTPFVIGSGGTTDRYIDSRMSSVDAHDDDFDNQIAAPDNYLTLMLSDNEESADDVIEDVENLGDFRPYSLTYQDNLIDVIKSGANVAGQDSSFIAPLGLMRWTADAGDEIIITVTGQMDL